MLTKKEYKPKENFNIPYELYLQHQQDLQRAAQGDKRARCGICRFYMKGECHVNAPMTVPSYRGSSKYRGVWPHVDSGNWCSRYKEGS